MFYPYDGEDGLVSWMNMVAGKHDFNDGFNQTIT